MIAAREAGFLGTGGGHAMAAGFSVAASCRDDLGALHGFLEARLAGAASLPMAPDLPVEASLDIAGCTVAMATDLGRLAPFGPANEEPLLVLPRVRVSRAGRVGKEGATLQAVLSDEAGSGRLKAVMFRAGEGPAAQALLARDGGLLHVAGHLRLEVWSGATRAGFVLTDVAACG